MHDIDRTQLEFGQEMSGFQSEQFEYNEAEWSGESVLSEADEIQLAGELLEVTNEAELDRFLGDFIKKVGSVAGSDSRQVKGDLERFKQFIESRGAESGAWRSEVQQDDRR